MGMGKTTLAASYALDNQDQYQHILWISFASVAETSESFRANVKAVGAQVTYEESEPKEKDFHKSLFRWLSNNTNYILIIDNVDVLQALEDVFNSEAVHLKGHVLVTTRNANVVKKFHSLVSKKDVGKSEQDMEAATVSLKPWTRLDTVGYLKNRIPHLDKRLQHSEELDAFNSICEHHVHDYPIVVEQFATYMLQSGLRRSFNDVAKRLDGFGWMKLLGINGRTALDSFSGLFQCSLETLGDFGDTGRFTLLLLCAIGTLAHSAIPIKLLKVLFPLLKDQWGSVEQDVEFESCVCLLEDLGLIKRFKESSQLSLHVVFYKVAFPLGWHVLTTSFDTSKIDMSEDTLRSLCWRAAAELAGDDVIWHQYYFPTELTQTSCLLAPHLVWLFDVCRLDGE
jgi:hypothetical protein